MASDADRYARMWCVWVGVTVLLILSFFVYAIGGFASLYKWRAYDYSKNPEMIESKLSPYIRLPREAVVLTFEYRERDFIGSHSRVQFKLPAVKSPEEWLVNLRTASGIPPGIDIESQPTRAGNDLRVESRALPRRIIRYYSHADIYEVFVGYD